MDILSDILPRAEKVPLEIRALYESRGFSKYRMGVFEPYEIYADNKQFLKADGMITFTDATGRLMALRPDVTMSIVKNAQGSGAAQKFYYNENVFRIDPREHEYREINQIGIEYIGGDPDYAQGETVSLALETLRLINDTYTLNISHMGLITEIFRIMNIPETTDERLLETLRQKNQHELAEIAKELKLSAREGEKLKRLAQLHGSLGEVLPEISEYLSGTEANSALIELKDLYAFLAAIGQDDKVFVDFSVVNGLSYYNGLVFRGFVPGVPRPVLAGGRYDKLLNRFGKDRQAIGFALYLTDLERDFHTNREYDADVLLIYENTPLDVVSKQVKALTDKGFSVRAEREDLGQIHAVRTLTIEDTKRWAEDD